MRVEWSPDSITRARAGLLAMLHDSSFTAPHARKEAGGRKGKRGAGRGECRSGGDDAEVLDATPPSATVVVCSAWFEYLVALLRAAPQKAAALTATAATQSSGLLPPLNPTAAADEAFSRGLQCCVLGSGRTD